jgi:outer membrane protein TolC
MRTVPRWGSGLLAVGLVLAGSTAYAEEPAPNTEPQPAPASAEPGPKVPGALAGPTSPQLSGQLDLSLQEAISLGIENNLDVQLQRFDPLLAAEDAIAAWGYYDPTLFGEYTYRHTETPIASALQASPILLEKEHAGLGGIRGFLPKLNWGYEIGYSGEALETTSSIQQLSPQYSTGLVATVTAPLLKNFLWSEPWLNVKTSQVLEGRARDQFAADLMDLVVNIEANYWGLIASEERLRVANKSLEANLTLLDQIKAQYDVGVVSRVEVVEAEAGVADRDFQRIQAENDYRAAQDNLIDVVLGPNLTPESTLEIRPTTQPDVVKYDIDPEVATAKAFENRPELAIAQADIENATMNLKFAKNQLLPQVDAVGTYGYNGISGRTSPEPDIFGGGGPRQPVRGLGRHYRDADDEFFSHDGARSWSAGAILSLPIGNITGRAEKRRADLELRRAETLLRRQEQQIILEIREAIRVQRAAQEGIEAAERGRIAAEEQFRAESIRLEHGESTPFDVLQREEALVQAESQKIGALQAYRNALAALDRRQGTILRERNVVIEQARTLR